MWNPSPPSIPAPSSKKVSIAGTPPREGTNSGNVMKSPSPFKSEEQQAELEALRQRGLAKLLNKHFSQETQRLAQEKKAVDAALQDLEERKRQAKNSSNKKNNVVPNSSMDDMYHKIHQMRAENRQKEKETLLLYQRYVHKFGFTGQVKSPEKNTPSKNKDATVATVSATTLSTPSKELQQLQEQGALAKVKQETTRINNTQQKAAASPAIIGTKNDEEYKQIYAQDDEDDGAADQEAKHLLEQYLQKQGDKHGEEFDVEDDLSSLISGLTSVDSATTRQILLDCELTVATFLDEERKAIQEEMMQKKKKQQDQYKADSARSLPPPTSSSSRKTKMKSNQQYSSSRSVGELSATSTQTEIQTHAALEAESMAQQMQQILKDFESGGTEDPATTVATTPSSDSASTKKGKPFPTADPNEEWVVLYDDHYQREYYHETRSGVTQWHAPDSTAKKERAIDYEDVMPETQSLASYQSDRIRKYRIRRKRRRRRRILRATAAVLAVLGVGGYYYYNHYNVSTPQESIDQPTAPSKAKTARVPVEIRVPESTARTTNKNTQKETMPTKVVEPTVEKPKESPPKQTVPKAEPEPKTKQSADSTTHVLPPPRPAGCNVPFSYLVHGGCRKLASENPLYTPEDLPFLQ